MALTGIRCDELTAITAPAYGDLFYLEADPASNKYHRKVTLQTLRGSIYNVRDYGAVGDGSTDDTAAIQAAIDAAESAGGGILFFPYGSYVITDGLTIDGADISVLGAAGAELLELSASLFTDPMLTVSGRSDFIIGGLAFTGAQTHAAYVGASDDYRCGIYLTGCSRFAVRDVKVTDKSCGVMAVSCTDGIITHNRLIGMMDIDDYGDGSNYNYSGAVRLGFGTSTTCTDMTVAQNVIRHWGCGVILSSSSSRNHIIGNHIESICNNGIYGSSGNDNLVQGNTVKDVQTDGIKMHSDRVRIIGNWVDNCGVPTSTSGGGIVVSGTGAASTDEYGAVVQGNTIRSTTSYGISIERETADTFNGWKVTGNDLDDCGDPTYQDGYGMSIHVAPACCNGVIRGNTIRGDNANTNKGAIGVIGASGTECVGITIEGNIIESPNNAGITLNYVEDFRVCGNILREVPGHGIYFLSADINVRGIIEGNLEDNQSAAGATLIRGGATGAIKNSRISGNLGFGNVTATVSSHCLDSTNLIDANKPAPQPDVAQTADDTLTTAESGRLFSNRGATAAVVVTLPAATPGLTFPFIKLAAYNYYIDPDGSQVIRGGGAGKQLQIANVGERFDLTCMESGTWEIEARNGTAVFET